MNEYIDKLGYILISDKKVLAVRSRGSDAWLTPGGKRDAGESDEEALTREVKEELSVDLIPDTIKYIKSFTAQAYGKAEGVMVRIKCYSGDFTGEIKPSSEIEETGWLASKDGGKTSVTGKMILEFLKNKDLID